MELNFGKVDLPVSFNRQTAFPLDAYSYFESKTTADSKVLTAKPAGDSTTTYYFGQLVSVFENDSAKVYKIDKVDGIGKLVELGSDLKISDISYDTGIKLSDILPTGLDSNNKLVASSELNDYVKISSNPVRIGTSTQGGSSQSGGVIIGNGSKITGSSSNSIAIGNGAEVSVQGGIAIGSSAKVSAAGAVQIGYDSTGTGNTEPNTLRFRNYPLIDANGKVVLDRIPALNYFPGTSLDGYFESDPFEQIVFNLGEYYFDLTTYGFGIVDSNYNELLYIDEIGIYRSLYDSALRFPSYSGDYTLATNKDLIESIYSNSLFGNTTKLYYLEYLSNDNLYTTKGILNNTGEFNKVIYANGKYYFKTNNEIYLGISPDYELTRLSSGITDLKYINNLFYARGGSTDPILYSSDCITWSRSSSYSCRSFTYSDGLFVNFDSVYSTGISYSTDFTNWTRSSATFPNRSYKLYSNNSRVFLLYSPYSSYRSTDGESWTEIEVPNVVDSYGEYFIAISSGKLKYSTDLIEWSDVIDINNVTEVRHGGKAPFVSGSQRYYFLVESSDGVTYRWSPINGIVNTYDSINSYYIGTDNGSQIYKFAYIPDEDKEVSFTSNSSIDNINFGNIEFDLLNSKLKLGNTEYGSDSIYIRDDDSSRILLYPEFAGTRTIATIDDIPSTNNIESIVKSVLTTAINDGIEINGRTYKLVVQ